MQVILCRRTGHCGGVQHHNAVVALADAQLVLRANHSKTLHAADFGLLEFELLSADGYQPGADRSQQHLLSCRYIRGAADNLQRLSGADIELGDVQMVAVGMLHALQHLGHHHTRKTARNLLHGLHVLNLKAGGGQNLRHLLGRQVKLEVIFKPIIRNSHKSLFKQ